jgi:hypothetical protein
MLCKNVTALDRSANYKASLCAIIDIQHIFDMSHFLLAFCLRSNDTSQKARNTLMYGL